MGKGEGRGWEGEMAREDEGWGWGEGFLGLRLWIVCVSVFFFFAGDWAKDLGSEREGGHLRRGEAAEGLRVAGSGFCGWGVSCGMSMAGGV